MGSWKKLMQRVMGCGLTADLSPNIRRGLVATNIAWAFFLCVSTPYLFLFAVLGQWRLAALAAPQSVVYGIVAWLMSRRRYDAARMLLLTTLTGAVFVFCILLSKDSELENTLYCTFLAPFLFFSANEPRKLACAVALPCVAHAALQLGAYTWMQPITMGYEALMAFRAMIAVSVALLLFVPLFLISRSQVRTEESLLRARDEADRANQAKSRFLATISHELRTPLNGVLGGLQVLEQEVLTPDQRAHLRLSRASGEALATMIGDLLDYSQLERQKVELQIDNIDIRAIVNETAGMFLIQTELKGIDLRVEIAENFPTCVRGDGARWRQVVVGLLGNAVKFTTQGGVVIKLHIGEHNKHGQTIVLEVRDTGIGIADDVRHALFQPFEQVNRQDLAGQAGVGVGLSMCRLIAKCMDAEISVDSAPGEGSTFRYVAPLVRGQLVTVQSQDTSGSNYLKVTQKTAHAHAEAPLILLVDDIASNQLIGRRLLESLGYRVDVVENGQLAVEATDRTDYAAVFMDVQMPVMDGLQATREIREREKAKGNFASRLRIIALTANAAPEDRQRCLLAGMDDFIGKPVRREYMAAALTGASPASPSPTAPSQAA